MSTIGSMHWNPETFDYEEYFEDSEPLKGNETMRFTEQVSIDDPGDAIDLLSKLRREFNSELQEMYSTGVDSPCTKIVQLADKIIFAAWDYLVQKSSKENTRRRQAEQVVQGYEQYKRDMENVAPWNEGIK